MIAAPVPVISLPALKVKAPSGFLRVTLPTLEAIFLAVAPVLTSKSWFLVASKPVSSEKVRPFLLVDNFHLVSSAAFPSSTNCHSTPFLTLVDSLVTSTFAAGALPCVATFNLDSLLVI